MSPKALRNAISDQDILRQMKLCQHRLTIVCTSNVPLPEKVAISEGSTSAEHEQSSKAEGREKLETDTCCFITA